MSVVTLRCSPPRCCCCVPRPYHDGSPEPARRGVGKPPTDQPNPSFRSVAAIGVSWSYCSQTFPGTAAESETETRTRVRYMEPLLPRIKALVSLHSFGQYLLYPWGSTRDPPPSWRQLVGCSARLSQGMHSKCLGTFLFRLSNVFVHH